MQDDGVLFEYDINSPSSEAKVNIYNRLQEYHVNKTKSRLLPIKVILKNSDLWTHAAVVKENAVLTNLPVLILRLTHNMNKFNTQVLTTTQSLKQKRSSALDLLYQPFLAYLTCLDR